MKRIQIFLILFMVFFIFPQQYVVGQIFKGEVILGTNISQVDGDEAFGFKKIGLTTGFGVVAPITKNFSLSLETLYSQKGSRQGKQRLDSLDGSYKLNLNYAEVPFMIQYSDKDVVSAGLGVSWNRLVSISESRHGMNIDTISLQSNVFSMNDWIGFGDVRVRVYKNFIANLRYSYSLSKIARRNIQDSETGKMNIRDFYNNYWSFRIIYMINETPPQRKVVRPKEEH